MLQNKKSNLLLVALASAASIVQASPALIPAQVAHNCGGGYDGQQEQCCDVGRHCCLPQGTSSIDRSIVGNIRCQPKGYHCPQGYEVSNGISFSLLPPSQCTDFASLYSFFPPHDPEHGHQDPWHGNDPDHPPKK